MKLAHVFLVVTLVSFLAGSGFTTSAEAQPSGLKTDRPAIGADVPKAKPGQGPLVGPAAPGPGARKADCFDEAAYARAKKQNKNLAGAQLCGADLKRVNLDGADLKGANLSGANLGDARLWKADLQGAVLSRANLGGATLSDSNLEGARLDRARIQLSKISKFGLLELSRQKKQSTIQEISYTSCPFCNGSGVRPSLEYTALSAFRKLESQAVKGQASEMKVSLPHEVANYLLNQKRMELCRLEGDYNLAIHISGSAEMNWDDVSITVTSREAFIDHAPPPETPEAKPGGKTQKNKDKKIKQHQTMAAPPVPVPAKTAPPPQVAEEPAAVMVESGGMQEMPAELPKKKSRRRTRRRKKRTTDHPGEEPTPMTIKSTGETPAAVSLGQGISRRED